MPTTAWFNTRRRITALYRYRKTLLSKVVITCLCISFLARFLFDFEIMKWPVLTTTLGLGLGFASAGPGRKDAAAAAADLQWYPPADTSINNLDTVLRGTGVYGFIFNSSYTPDEKYGTYNWCNMPHVRKTEYVRPPAGYKLKYVEMIQRHHKRTPYAANAFPVESYHWDCDDQGLYYYGSPFEGDDKRPANGYWQGFTSPVNPYVPSGWIGTCQFPQLTAAGLDDAYVHGEDIYGVYHDLLGFLPGRHEDWRSKVAYRVTHNVITSQVAGMLIGGTWATTDSIPLLIEAVDIDSLEPQYPCAVGSELFNNIKSDENAAWRAHLDGAKDLYRILDDISGVPPDDEGFHESLDHYFDNLSARQCHDKPLPCQIGDASSGTCVDQNLADAVYRLGQWEYSHIYRDAPDSLAASTSSFGVWIAQLAAHLRAVVAGEDTPLYFHNVAHDGSVSRLLSILQIDVMFWPGMGSEVVFELYERTKTETIVKAARDVKNELSSEQKLSEESGRGEYYVRVLFGGQVLRSSNPSLGVMDMLPVETLLNYFDGLVGREAGLVMGKCNGTIGETR
ncbi:histidine acid phosphatase [Poronia punctata]|nr:histidine acid phosphatase [Poronia punctata]